MYWVTEGLGNCGREEEPRLKVVGGGRKGGKQLCEREGLAVNGTKVWKVEGDGMAGTILLLMVGRGILFQTRLYLMVSWAMLGSLENKTL